MNYENEIWKDIIIEKNGVVYDYTGLYKVSNYGRVKSLDRVDSNGHKVKGKIMESYNNGGYLFVNLSKDGKQQQFYIHRLVATMFIPNPKNLPIVNHKNELKYDNVWTNLEWCTHKYNTNYGTCLKRMSEKRKGEKHPMYGRTGSKSPRARKVICLETKQIFGCAKDAQGWLGKGGVANCLTGRSKTAGGYHWQYYDDYLRGQRKQSDINNSMVA